MPACCAPVTEDQAQAWHSGPACGPWGHRKPAAVTQAGYAYCQLRDTKLSVQTRRGHGPRGNRAGVFRGRRRLCLGGLRSLPRLGSLRGSRSLRSRLLQSFRRRVLCCCTVRGRDFCSITFLGGCRLGRSGNGLGSSLGCDLRRDLGRDLGLILFMDLLSAFRTWPVSFSAGLEALARDRWFQLRAPAPQAA